MLQAESQRIRVFFAAFPDTAKLPELHAFQVRALRACHTRKMRPIRLESLHVTLSFLGACGPSAIRLLIEAGQRIFADARVFQARTGSMLALPDDSRPSVIALELASTGILEALADGARSCACGIAAAATDGRSFRAHLSLARVRGAVSLGPDPAPLTLSFSRLGLYTRQIKTSGSLYSPLWETRLPDSHGDV